MVEERQKLTYIGLTPEEIWLYKEMCRHYGKWRRFFDEDFEGSLYMTKAKNNPKIKFKWQTEEED